MILMLTHDVHQPGGCWEGLGEVTTREENTEAEARCLREVYAAMDEMDDDQESPCALAIHRSLIHRLRRRQQIYHSLRREGSPSFSALYYVRQRPLVLARCC